MEKVTCVCSVPVWQRNVVMLETLRHDSIVNRASHRLSLLLVQEKKLSTSLRLMPGMYTFQIKCIIFDNKVAGEINIKPLTLKIHVIISLTCLPV